MAQAASALQQSGLAPYLLQQQYGAQLAQLQQTALLQSWAASGHHHQPASAFDAFSAMLTGFQAAASLPRQPTAGLPADAAAAAAAYSVRAAGKQCCNTFVFPWLLQLDQVLQLLVALLLVFMKSNQMGAHFMTCR